MSYQAIRKQLLDKLTLAFTQEDAEAWLYTAQKRLGGLVPMNMVKDNRTPEVLAVIDQLLDGAFI